MILGFLTGRASRTIALVFALNGFIFGNWFARIPAVKADLGLSDGVLGLALLGAPVGALAIMSAAGWLVARFGAARVTMLSSALLCLALPGPALAVGPWTLALALALMGLTSGAMDIAMNAEAAMVEQRSGRSIMVGFHAMFSLGGAAGAIAGGIGAITAGPLPHLTLAAVIGLGALVWRRGSLPHEEPPAGGAHVFAWPRGPLLPVALVTFASMLAEGAAADWSAVYIREVLDATPAMAATGFAAFATAMTVGRLLGDPLGDRLGEGRVVQLGALIGGLGLGLGLMAGVQLAAVLGFACLGLGLAAIVPICLRRAATVPGMSAGHGLAAVAMVGYTGFLAGPPLIGFVAEATGLGVSLCLVPLLVLLVAATSNWALGPPPRVQPTPA